MPKLHLNFARNVTAEQLQQRFEDFLIQAKRQHGLSQRDIRIFREIIEIDESELKISESPGVGKYGIFKTRKGRIAINFGRKDIAELFTNFFSFSEDVSLSTYYNSTAFYLENKTYPRNNNIIIQANIDEKEPILQRANLEIETNLSEKQLERRLKKFLDQIPRDDYQLERHIRINNNKIIIDRSFNKGYGVYRGAKKQVAINLGSEETAKLFRKSFLSHLDQAKSYRGKPSLYLEDVPYENRTLRINTELSLPRFNNLEQEHYNQNSEILKKHIRNDINDLINILENEMQFIRAKHFRHQEVTPRKQKEFLRDPNRKNIYSAILLLESLRDRENYYEEIEEHPSLKGQTRKQVINNILSYDFSSLPKEQQRRIQQLIPKLRHATQEMNDPPGFFQSVFQQQNMSVANHKSQQKGTLTITLNNNNFNRDELSNFLEQLPEKLTEKIILDHDSGNLIILPSSKENNIGVYNNNGNLAINFGDEHNASLFSSLFNLKKYGVHENKRQQEILSSYPDLNGKSIQELQEERDTLNYEGHIARTHHDLATASYCAKKRDEIDELLDIQKNNLSNIVEQNEYPDHIINFEKVPYNDNMRINPDYNDRPLHIQNQQPKLVISFSNNIDHRYLKNIHDHILENSEQLREKIKLEKDKIIILPPCLQRNDNGNIAIKFSNEKQSQIFSSLINLEKSGAISDNNGTLNLENQRYGGEVKVYASIPTKAKKIIKHLYPEQYILDQQIIDQNTELYKKYEHYTIEDLKEEHKNLLSDGISIKRADPSSEALAPLSEQMNFLKQLIEIRTIESFDERIEGRLNILEKLNKRNPNKTSNETQFIQEASSEIIRYFIEDENEHSLFQEEMERELENILSRSIQETTNSFVKPFFDNQQNKQSIADRINLQNNITNNNSKITQADIENFAKKEFYYKVQNYIEESRLLPNFLADFFKSLAEDAEQRMSKKSNNLIENYLEEQQQINTSRNIKSEIENIRTRLSTREHINDLNQGKHNSAFSTKKLSQNNKGNNSPQQGV